MILYSPAKLNLYFRVLKKREDGYHDIFSVFQTIDLVDTLSFSPSPSFQLTTSLPSLPVDERNLVTRAHQLFEKTLKKPFPISIELVKNIPLQSGLGGGSSNAATTLWGLNQLAGAPFSQEKLMELASCLGADVSFFLVGGSALCEGIGEKVTALPEQISKKFLLIKPSWGLSTASVYQKCKISGIAREECLEQILPLTKLTSYQNDLELAAQLVDPRVGEIKKNLMELGFSSVCMTGSGSSFFCQQTQDNHPLAESYKRSFPLLQECQFFHTHTIQKKQAHWY